MLGQEGRDALTKDMDQLYRGNVPEPISIKDMTQQENRRAQRDITIFEQNSTTKNTQGKNGFQWKTN